MQYWGKVLGAALLFFMGGGFWGILSGALIGHAVDSVLSRKRRGFSGQQARQELIFQTTFEVMGHLTKSKGRVTEDDIRIASLLMDRMQLSGESRRAAQTAFRTGKENNYPLRDKIRQLRSACFGRFDLIQMFLDIQVQAALADGDLHPNELKILQVITKELGIPAMQFERFIRMSQGRRPFEHRRSHQGARNEPQRPTLTDAFNVLGISNSADPTTIKRAYRKLMSEHHPDKLVAKGLPPEMMQMAKQKAQEIQQAYDLIKTTKGFK